MKKAALYLSVLFHPVFVNLCSLICLLWLNPYLNAALTINIKLFYIALIFTATAIIPLITVSVRYLLGFSESIMLKQAEERHTPYLISASCYLVAFYLCAKITAPVGVQAFLLASASTVVAVSIINFFFKISAHTTSLGSLCGLLAALSFHQTEDMRFLIGIAILVSGIVGSARLVLAAHTKKELYSGFALGAIIMWLIL